MAKTTAAAAAATAAATPNAPNDTIALPEPIEPTMLAKVLAEQPGAYDVIDLRPTAQFAEWTIPGAKNVRIDTLAAHLAALPADARVVLVDRDGTHAFAVAGALMARQPRVLRVLYGGLQRFHRDVVLGSGAPMPTAATNPPATTPTPTPAAPKKRSAGC